MKTVRGNRLVWGVMLLQLKEQDSEQRNAQDRSVPSLRSHLTDKQHNFFIRFGQILMTVGAALAVLGLIEIQPIRHAFWSHWIGATLFLIGVILVVYGKR